ncbi:MAG TPA: DUF192 domain-containing protein [Rubrobacteraceae bacterium]|nr:DUF192 domain-containing protein [Rubrobacteraceae bacterium]
MRALLLLVLLSSLLVGCAETAERPEPTAAPAAGTTAEPEETAGGTESRTVTINASSGERVRVRVEIADNHMGRIIGLRGRESLPENRGMLFVYAEEAKRAFTMEAGLGMEGTLIPLSIAFMDSRGHIVDIQDMEPGRGGYVSAKPAQYALEVNQGFFDSRGVEVGDSAELPV